MVGMGVYGSVDPVGMVGEWSNPSPIHAFKSINSLIDSLSPITKHGAGGVCEVIPTERGRPPK